MKFQFLTFFLFVLFSQNVNAQDTFSIVAVDKETGEVGGAGATCLDTERERLSVEVISDVFPGRGAIHTQASYLKANQTRARLELLGGSSPQEVVDYMQLFDVQNNPQSRQYGIADFDPNGAPRAAAFTGVNCFDIKHHIVGDYYSIQGNILLDSTILRKMEENFLQTTGSLADRLMAAMQGAKIPGADSRCLVDGVSSRSAVFRVAKPDDMYGNPYLNLLIPVTPDGVDPIDALQDAYDVWKLTSNVIKTFEKAGIQLFPNPTNGNLKVVFPTDFSFKNTYLKIFDLTGKVVRERQVSSLKTQLNMTSNNNGLYFIQIQNGSDTYLKRFLKQ